MVLTVNAASWVFALAVDGIPGGAGAGMGTADTVPTAARREARMYDFIFLFFFPSKLKFDD